jgi:hypothetical protein
MNLLIIIVNNQKKIHKLDEAISQSKCFALIVLVFGVLVY